jgi:hypothetical protein
MVLVLITDYSEVVKSVWITSPISRYQDHTGRPDVIAIEIISEDLIVDVKNSANEDTIRRGIKETLEYLAFLRLNEEYVFGRDDEEYFGVGWNGLLVVQDLQRETASLE